MFAPICICCCRLTKDHIVEIETLAKAHFGSANEWEDGDMAAIGKLFSMMSSETITAVKNVIVFSQIQVNSKMSLLNTSINCLDTHKLSLVIHFQ